MLPVLIQLQNSSLRAVIKRLRFPLEIMLVCVRWSQLGQHLVTFDLLGVSRQGDG